MPWVGMVAKSMATQWEERAAMRRAALALPDTCTPEAEAATCLIIHPWLQAAAARAGHKATGVTAVMRIQTWSVILTTLAVRAAAAQAAAGAVLMGVVVSVPLPRVPVMCSTVPTAATMQQARAP